MSPFFENYYADIIFTQVKDAAAITVRHEGLHQAFSLVVELDISEFVRFKHGSIVVQRRLVLCDLSWGAMEYTGEYYGAE